MATTTLLDRAERTSAELSDAARAHLTEAEEYASQAAESARLAAEHYAETLSDQFGETVGSLREDVGSLREGVESLLEDPETRALVVGVAAGVTVTGLAVWLWRRRKKRRAEESYENSASDVAGWSDPRSALAEAASS